MSRFINFALAQFSPVLADMEKNIAKHCAFIKKAIEQKADIVIFPELSLTGYALKDAAIDMAMELDDPRLEPILKLSADISIVLGCVELGPLHQIYNTQLFIEDGAIVSRHRKVYLPTYGVFEEARYFASGNRFRAFNSKLGTFGMLICEDIWHASSALVLALDGASIMLVSSAGLTRGIGHEKKPENVASWETIIKSMAITSTSYVVFCNRVGVEDGLMFWGGSEVVNPAGKCIAKASYYKEELMCAQIDMHKLKHARINTTLLSDEKLSVLIDEFSRINEKNREY